MCGGRWRRESVRILAELGQKVRDRGNKLSSIARLRGWRRSTMVCAGGRRRRVRWGRVAAVDLASAAPPIDTSVCASAVPLARCPPSPSHCTTAPRVLAPLRRQWTWRHRQTPRPAATSLSAMISAALHLPLTLYLDRYSLLQSFSMCCPRGYLRGPR